MATINDFRGIPRELSDQVYVLGPNPTPFDIPDYIEGAEVRMIAGIDDNWTPGYHFDQGFVTVCRVGAETAEFIGVKRSRLKPKAAQPIP